MEVLALDAEFKAAAVEPVLATAARLGAVAVCVRGDDLDRTRLADSYAELATLCGTYGLAACLEFMPWTAVTTARAAVDIVKQADGLARGVLVDALHAAHAKYSHRLPNPTPIVHRRRWPLGHHGCQLAVDEVDRLRLRSISLKWRTEFAVVIRAGRVLFGTD